LDLVDRCRLFSLLSRENFPPNSLGHQLHEKALRENNTNELENVKLKAARIMKIIDIRP